MVVEKKTQKVGLPPLEDIPFILEEDVPDLSELPALIANATRQEGRISKEREKRQRKKTAFSEAALAEVQAQPVLTAVDDHRRKLGLRSTRRRTFKGTQSK